METFYVRKELRNISIFLYGRVENVVPISSFCNTCRKCHLNKIEDKHLKPVTVDTFKTSQNETQNLLKIRKY